MHKIIICHMMIGFLLSAAFLRAEEKPKEVLIKFKSHLDSSAVEQLIQQHGLIIVQKYTMIEKLYLCQIPEDKKIEKVLEELQKCPEIEYAEKNEQVTVLKNP